MLSGESFYVYNFENATSRVASCKGRFMQFNTCEGFNVMLRHAVTFTHQSMINQVEEMVGTKTKIKLFKSPRKKSNLLLHLLKRDTHKYDLTYRNSIFGVFSS